MRPDLIDSFFGLSLFKQLFFILLLGPLAASIWGLAADWKHTRVARVLDLPRRAAGPHGDDAAPEDVRTAA